MEIVHLYICELYIWDNSLFVKVVYLWYTPRYVFPEEVGVSREKYHSWSEKLQD